MDKINYYILRIYLRDKIYIVIRNNDIVCSHLKQEYTAVIKMRHDIKTENENRLELNIGKARM